MKRIAVINVVGLTESLLGPHLPRITAFAQRGARAVIVPAFPAVTCTAQSNYLTGVTPARHGIVGNGWYDRALAEVQFWKQSGHLVGARKLWEELGEGGRPKAEGTNPAAQAAILAGFTCAKLFWWFNLYSGADYALTPRPIYPADGRKIFDISTWPFSVRNAIKADLGEFPFAAFWGPAAGVNSPHGPLDAASRWIAESAKWIENHHQPTLNLVYLPHLDYNLQRHGSRLVAADVSRRTGQPGASASETPAPRVGGHGLNPAILPDLRAIDAIVGDLFDFFQQREVQVVLLSEYGLTPVSQPIHLNRVFRQAGWLAIKEELGLERLDCGASRVFAVADHQVAHIYLNDPSLENAVRSLLEKQDGIGEMLDRAGKAAAGVDHPRAGDLIAVAAEHAWFTYYYWLDDALAPDFARTVDIHRKPGYDPVELFLDPAGRFLRAKVAWRLLQKRLGFRMLMDVVPLDATLIRGSHGRRPADRADWPLLISGDASLLPERQLESTDVYSVLRRHVRQ